MKRSILLAIMLLASTHSHADSDNLMDLDELTTFTGIATAAAVVGGACTYIALSYFIKQHPLSYFTALAEGKLEIAQEFLDDYKAYKTGQLDSCIINRYPHSNWPAHAYVQRLKTVLTDLRNLQHALHTKRSYSYLNEQDSIDRLTRVIIITRIRLKTLQQAVIESKTYSLEKHTYSWPIKTLALGLIAGWIIKSCTPKSEFYLSFHTH